MRSEKLIAPVVALALLAGSAACSADKITCTYVTDKNVAIPDPAFWAETEKDNLQLIEPDSKLADIIRSHVGSVTIHSGATTEGATGDILVATEKSFVVSPEDLGVDRDTIKYCQPEPPHAEQPPIH